MPETIASIATWHGETFPHATLASQLQKFKDETQEFNQSAPTTEDEIFELADMFIVACGISRFDSYEVMYCFGAVTDKLSNSIWATKDLAKAVNKKMEINRARK